MDNGRGGPSSSLPKLVLRHFLDFDGGSMRTVWKQLLIVRVSHLHDLGQCEVDAIAMYGEHKHLIFCLVARRLTSGQTSAFGSTPDALLYM